VERFQSLTDPDKLLSLSFWRDEVAVAGWRRIRNIEDAKRREVVTPNAVPSRAATL
jgi:heme-degrading monooxygenase HmoA